MFAKQSDLARRLERRTGTSQRPMAGPGIRDNSRSFRLDGPGERRRALRFKPLLAAALAVPVLVLLATTVEAACGVRDRVSHRDSECLQAWWDNKNNKYEYNTYHVRNMCSELGRVVAKVDLREARDRTPYLDNSQWRIGYTDNRIDWIYCCSDLSTLCNRSDLDRRDGRTSALGARAKGSVPDNSALAGAWLAGFGRSVASAQVDRLGERLAAGDRQPHLTLGGHRIDLAPGPEDGNPGENAYTGAGRWQAPTGRDFAGPVDDGPDRPVATAMTGRDFLSSSSFLFTGGEAAYRRWSGWASTAPLRFPEAHGAHGDGRLDLLGTDLRARAPASRGGAFARVGHGRPGAGRVPGNRDFAPRGASLYAAGAG